MHFEKFGFFEDLREVLEARTSQVVSLVERGEFAELSGVLSSLSLVSEVCQTLDFQDTEIEELQKTNNELSRQLEDLGFKLKRV